MATILLAAAGGAIGSAFGGSVLGLSSAVIGRAVGATLGRVIDARLLGSGSEPIEVGRLERYRISGASEGTALGLSYARTRVAGQVIWATRFEEREQRDEVGGKGGGGSRQTTITYSYRVSLALALGEGPVLSVPRVWADGQEIPREDLDLRLYPGDRSQQPDPKIEAVEGAGNAPAFRGTAYVVIEDMELGEFGNRVPQLSFEVIRPTDPGVVPYDARPLSTVIRGVALMPGSGDYALASERVTFDEGIGRTKTVNMNASRRRTDIEVSLDQLREEVPSCRATSLIVSWFGDDLRCGDCQLRPKVEQKLQDSDTMPWAVSGLSRASAGQVPYVDGRPVYGGTPTDRSVLQAIAALKARGQHVTFYPFILMEQLSGNALPNPLTGAVGQPVLPWRGRITTSLAPGLPGSPDGTSAAEAQVRAFFGDASPADFVAAGQGASASVSYAGPAEFSYRRFILHYAHLCARSGAVDAFCIGSEMRGLTQIRGPGDSFPAVAEMVRLLRNVRGILGPGVKLGYAADWSEYFGYHPQDGSGDVFFHLDPLWSDPDCDFIGIDNYMPLSDWRDGGDHLDAQAGVASIYDADYLAAGVAGGEGYDWYYPSKSARDAQARAPIEDGAYGEPWVFRYKDIRGWWENPHHERRGGVRLSQPTAWQPRSKPVWFTEYGCAAMDKATNQPNKFLDPKSSESVFPYYSTGGRDEYIQAQYLRAMSTHWDAPANNPVSPLYGGRMVDMSKAHVWSWDARPYPHFPSRTDLWSDGANYDRGHWLNGRVSSESLAAVVADLCDRCGVTDVDVSQVWGLVRGYSADLSGGGRSALQPLMLCYGMDAFEHAGTLRFRMRDGRSVAQIVRGETVVSDETEGAIDIVSAPDAETPARVRLGFVRARSNYSIASTEAAFPGEEAAPVAQSDLALVLTETEARGVAERWLAEGRVGREAARFVLPPSRRDLGPGDVVELAGQGALYRIDRVETAAGQVIDAQRVEADTHVPTSEEEPPASLPVVATPAPVAPFFLDLPLLTGAEEPHAPHVAVAAEPWPGPVAVLSSAGDGNYALNRVVSAPATVGVTLDDLAPSAPGRWDRGAPLRVAISSGGPLASVDETAVLAGANAFAIGDGSAEGWEIFQARRAELVAGDTWALSERLRGQLGTEGEMRRPWPAGSVVIALDPALVQLGLPPSARGVTRYFRIGAADLPPDDPAVVTASEAFAGVGLRPYAPVHLRMAERADGSLALRWTRRTRIDGDSWTGADVPLAEESERYRVQVRDAAGEVLRSAEVSVPEWIYSPAARQEDGAAAAAFEVAQLSVSYGAGTYGRIEIDV